VFALHRQRIRTPEALGGVVAFQLRSSALQVQLSPETLQVPGVERRLKESYGIPAKLIGIHCDGLRIELPRSLAADVNVEQIRDTFWRLDRAMPQGGSYISACVQAKTQDLLGGGYRTTKYRMKKRSSEFG
jgi:hypothetical protein